MRIGLAEDVTLLREGIAAILTATGHHILWSVADADELAARLDNDADLPDLLIADVRMPPTDTDDGIRVAVDLRARHPEIGILILSQHLGNEYAKTLLSTAPDAEGGTGYLLKERVGRVADFLATIEVIGEGGISIDPKVVAHLLDPKASNGALEALSEREHTVLALMAEGRTNEQISRMLHLSAATVERHISTIFTALGLHSKAGNRRVLAVLEHLRGR